MSRHARAGIRALRRRGLAVAIAVGLLCTALAACQSQLTPEGTPYRTTVDGDALHVTNSASGDNNRETLRSSTTSVTTDSTECARWVSGAGITQNGLAFRIRQDSGGWDAVVLERNIFFHGFWMFKVIYFHSGKGQKYTFDVAPQDADLGDYLGRSTDQNVFPLRVCGELKGNVLRFAVAKDDDAMVPLGTAGRGATLVLNPPTVNRQAGQTGTYLAHLPALSTAVVDGITIDGAPAPMPNT